MAAASSSSSAGRGGHGGLHSYDMEVKLITVGNSHVGKTALLLRYGENRFSNSFIMTIGIDFKVKYVNIDGNRMKLKISDTTGQERFRAITTSHYRGAQGFLVVYDITDRESFDNVDYWMAAIHRNADEHASIVLVGNKSDLTRDRVVTEKEGKRLAEKYSLPFYETSAKDGTNVAEVFEHLAKLTKNRSGIPGPASGQGRADVRQAEEENKAGCCS